MKKILSVLSHRHSSRSRKLIAFLLFLALTPFAGVAQETQEQKSIDEVLRELDTLSKVLPQKGEREEENREARRSANRLQLEILSLRGKIAGARKMLESVNKGNTLEEKYSLLKRDLDLKALARQAEMDRLLKEHLENVRPLYAERHKKNKHLLEFSDYLATAEPRAHTYSDKLRDNWKKLAKTVDKLSPKGTFQLILMYVEDGKFEQFTPIYEFVDAKTKAALRKYVTSNDDPIAFNLFVMLNVATKRFTLLAEMPATIIAEAIDGKELRWRGKEGESLAYASHQIMPYTGWVKWMYDNGQLEKMTQFKDGKQVVFKSWSEDGKKRSEDKFKDGKLIEMTFWQENGQKEWENTWKDGKWDLTHWYKSGQKRQETTMNKDFKLMTSVAWKPNGKKCPETNVVNGNGVVLFYRPDGTEEGRITYKDGNPHRRFLGGVEFPLPASPPRDTSVGN